jgi:hypothetical protein
MAWAERKVLTAARKEKACKEVSLQGWTRQAVLLSAGDLRDAQISLRTPAVVFDVSSHPDGQNRAHP